MVLRLVGVLLGVVVLYLTAVTFGPGFGIRPPVLEPLPRRSPHFESESPTNRRGVTFEVDGLTLSAWLYLPEESSRPLAAVVMVNGLGGTKEIILEPYALRFAEAGFAVLTYDNRFFGESEGEPRQLLWIPHQLEDLSAAIAFTRSRPEIDGRRIALWGTSAGGGYVITAAASDPGIAAVIAQVPGLDGAAAADAMLQRNGAGLSFLLFMHGQRDMVRRRLGLEPHRIPLVGRPGTVAMMNTPDAYDFFATVADDRFVNEACARVILRGGLYRPLDQLERVRSPILVQIAEYDALAPPTFAAAIRDVAQVVTYRIGHFDIYFGDHFDRAVRDQLAFLDRHLR